MNINSGTYVSLQLTKRSADRLYQYGLDNDIPNLFPRDEFHITVCYSKRPLHFVPLGVIPPMPVKPKHLSLFGKDNDYLVLEVSSNLAQNRNALAMMSGGISDFDEYKPHISLAKDTGLESVDDLPPFEDLLFVNRETTTVLNTSYSGGSDRLDPIALKMLFAFEIDAGFTLR